MKIIPLRFLLLALTLGFTSFTHAQTINGKSIVDLEDDYIRIISALDESDIYIDFGARINAPKYNNRLASLEERNVIKGDDGYDRIFSSAIDAINFMADSGYELVQSYAVHEKSHTSHFYILKKK